MNRSAVQLQQVAQRLGGRWALRGVSLSIAPGELVAIVGHNGSGKTTLLRVICTALRPTRGGGTVFGHDLRDAPDQVRSLVNMLAHSGGLYADLTAFENLSFAQRMNGEREDEKKISASLSWAGLQRAADMRLRTFSSGMRRRLSLAAVFMRRSALLLMDEPYNSLDPEGGGLIDDLLQERRASGGAAIAVLHDLSRSTVKFDRIIEMRDGLIAENDSQPSISVPSSPSLVRSQ